MAVARVRCTYCRKYVLREEVYYDSGVNRVCSVECFSSLKERTRIRSREKAKAHTAPKPRRENRLDLSLRKRVRCRDGNVCRWCGKPGEQVHHILYRSQGGPDIEHNLILLCVEHHAQAHSNKRHWQPILLAIIWTGYVNGRWRTVPEMERILQREGLLIAA